MVTATAASTERLADHFVTYLFGKYQGTRHVRRVATWIGFLLKAIERATGGNLGLGRTRQIIFKYHGHRFKARYNHRAGSRGGVEIVEVLAGPGGPVGQVAITVTNLSEAEDFYRSLEERLDGFISA